jgi:damage-control phosphatase, subfamily III
VYRTVTETDDTAKADEGKKIVNELATLKYELQHNRQLTPIRDDGKPDVALYNQELEKLGAPTWFNVAWLYSECYLYRY